MQIAGKIDKSTVSSHKLSDTASDMYDMSLHSYSCLEEGCEYYYTEAHTFGEDGKCTAEGCSAVKVENCEHDFSEVGNDSTNHWTKCSICGEIKEGSKKAHTLGEYTELTSALKSAKCTFEGCNYVSKKYNEDYVIENEQNNNNNNNDNNGISNNGNNNSSGAGNNSNANSNQPNTQIQGNIPYAGNRTMIGIIIFASVLGIVSFIKFKKIY